VAKTYNSGWHSVDLADLNITVPGCKVGDILEIHLHFTADYASYGYIGDRIRARVFVGSVDQSPAAPLIGMLAGGDNRLEEAFCSMYEVAVIKTDGAASCYVEINPGQARVSRTWYGGQCGVLVKRCTHYTPSV
jgi:hypothetical protein